MDFVDKWQRLLGSSTASDVTRKVILCQSIVRRWYAVQFIYFPRLREFIRAMHLADLEGLEVWERVARKEMDHLVRSQRARIAEQAHLHLEQLRLAALNTNHNTSKDGDLVEEEAILAETWRLAAECKTSHEWSALLVQFQRSEQVERLRIMGSEVSHRMILEHEKYIPSYQRRPALVRRWYEDRSSIPALSSDHRRGSATVGEISGRRLSSSSNADHQAPPPQNTATVLASSPPKAVESQPKPATLASQQSPASAPEANRGESSGVKKNTENVSGANVSSSSLSAFSNPQPSTKPVINVRRSSMSDGNTNNAIPAPDRRGNANHGDTSSAQQLNRQPHPQQSTANRDIQLVNLGAWQNAPRFAMPVPTDVVLDSRHHPRAKTQQRPLSTTEVPPQPQCRSSSGSIASRSPMGNLNTNHHRQSGGSGGFGARRRNSVELFKNNRLMATPFGEDPAMISEEDDEEL